MGPTGLPLSDDLYAAIAWADPSESTADLSQRPGVHGEVVRQHRQHIASDA